MDICVCHEYACMCVHVVNICVRIMCSHYECLMNVHAKVNMPAYMPQLCVHMCQECHEYACMYVCHVSHVHM